MLRRLKNIVRSWSEDESQEMQNQMLLEQMNLSLEASNKAIEQLKTQLQQHEQNMLLLEKESNEFEKEGKLHVKNGNKARAEVSISKMYRTDERLNHLRTIYTELSNSLGDLQTNRQKVEYKIHQYQHKKLVLKAKTISTTNELEVIKNLSSLDELNDLDALEEQLLEAQCLTEAFDNIHNEPTAENSTMNLNQFEEKLDLENKKQEAAELDRIAKMMGESPKKQNNEQARAKALRIQQEFESTMKTMNNTSKSDLLEKWITETKKKESRHHDKIDDFFSQSSNEDIIDKFFN